MRELYDALEGLEAELNGAGKGLFSKRAAVDADKCLELLATVKRELAAQPADLAYAVRESERILRQANERAATLLREAERRAAELVDQSSVVQAALVEAEEIRRGAREDSRRTYRQSRDRLEELLYTSERSLSEALKIISNSREELKER